MWDRTNYGIFSELCLLGRIHGKLLRLGNFRRQLRSRPCNLNIHWLFVASTWALLLSQNFYHFLAVPFVTGFFLCPQSTAAYVSVAEWCHRDKLSGVSMTIFVTFGIGASCCSLVAYVFQGSWKYQVFIAVLISITHCVNICFCFLFSSLACLRIPATSQYSTITFLFALLGKLLVTARQCSEPYVYIHPRTAADNVED